MTLELFIAFNLALLAAIASPGPALLMSIRTSVVKGYVSGIKLGIGLAFMASMWTLAALMGLESVFALFPWTYLFVKIAGAIYLLYIAWNTWRNAKSPIGASGTIADHAFRDGVLLNLANPKSVLFSAAVLIVIFPPDLSLAAKGFIVLNHFALEVFCYTIIALVMSSKAVSDKYLAAKTALDRFAAVILGGLGLRLLLQR
ncbi:MAG: LysE family translocator [Pseudomonadota bacterium]